MKTVEAIENIAKSHGTFDRRKSANPAWEFKVCTSGAKRGWYAV